MQFNKDVQQALRHIHGIFPAVTQVFYGSDGRWMYCDENLEAPDFDEAYVQIDFGLLDDAASAADNAKGFPCAYRLLTLDDYYALWDQLADIPVSEGTAHMEPDTIELQFLHFEVGTHRETIWKWFEDQHPEFIVGDVQQGIRRGASWEVSVTMGGGTTFNWSGKADDRHHAEGLAIAEAVSRTGKQVLETVRARPA